MRNPINIIQEKFIGALWNARNFNVANEIFSENFVTQSIGINKSNWEEAHGKGPESMKHHIAWWLNIMPDMKFTVIDIAAIENKVIYHWEAAGTMKNEMYGAQPTNENVNIIGMTVSVFENNLITLNKTLVDVLGLLQQINILPSFAEILQQRQ